MINSPKTRTVIFLIIWILPLSAQPQVLVNDQYTNFPDKTIGWRSVVLGGTVLSAIGSLYLFADDAYYNDQTVPFHFDRSSDGSLDWFDNYHRGIDKFGHIYSTSLFSQNFYLLARWSGYKKPAASWLAIGSATTVLTAMEIWDAHFESWGFSVGDFTANIIGASIPVARENFEFMENINYKMSYNFIAPKSPDPGIHDYEHLTFWLTINPAGFITRSYLPEWLSFFNFAVGYGLEKYSTQKQEIYVALDYNLSHFKTKNVYLNHLIKLVDRYHLPAPAIRLAPGYVAYGLFF